MTLHQNTTILTKARLTTSICQITMLNRKGQCQSGTKWLLKLEKEPHQQKKDYWHSNSVRNKKMRQTKQVNRAAIQELQIKRKENLLALTKKFSLVSHQSQVAKLKHLLVIHLRDSGGTTINLKIDRQVAL